MFTIGTHNVMDVHNVRISEGLTEGEGYITLEIHCETYHGSGEEVSNEYTFFFKDLNKGYSTLIASLEKGMDKYNEDNDWGCFY